jgi:hypothetical protein
MTTKERMRAILLGEDVDRRTREILDAALDVAVQVTSDSACADADVEETLRRAIVYAARRLGVRADLS